MKPETSQPTLTALVIDDEPQIRRLLHVTLEANGYRVFDAATGQEGIVQAAQRKPDVILLDLGLPDLDGVAVVKRLREWSQVPVVILSVRDSEDDKVAALDAGADRIEVAVENGGFSLIRVVDNGCGRDCFMIKKTGDGCRKSNLPRFHANHTIVFVERVK